MLEQLNLFFIFSVDLKTLHADDDVCVTWEQLNPRIPSLEEIFGSIPE